MNPIYLLIFYIISQKDKNKINTSLFITLILLYNNSLKNTNKNIIKNNLYRPKSKSYNKPIYNKATNNINKSLNNNFIKSSNKVIKSPKDIKSNLLNNNYNKPIYNHYDKINIDDLITSYEILYIPLSLDKIYIKDDITSTTIGLNTNSSTIIPNNDSTSKSSILLDNAINNLSSNINTNLQNTENIGYDYYDKDNYIILNPSEKPKFNISKGSAEFDSLYIKKVDTDIRYISKCSWIKNSKVNKTLNLNNNFNMHEYSNCDFTMPTSIIKCDISNLFKISIDFSTYINSISDIKSNLIITSNLSLLDTYDKNKGVLFFEGYLEISIYYSIPLKQTLPLRCNHSNCIITIPFIISGPIDLEYTDPFSKNIYNNLDISLTQVSLNIEKDFSIRKKLDDSISLYKKCDLTLDVKYSLEIFKNELFSY